MIKRVRLIPIVLLAAGSLFLLKIAHLGLNYLDADGAGWVEQTSEQQEAAALASLADRMKGEEPAADDRLAAAGDRPDGADVQDVDPIVTGQVDGEAASNGPPSGFQLSEGFTAAAARRAAALRSARKNDSNVREVILGQDPESELAILERLSDRRRELEARTDQLELRENLLQAAEKRIEERIGELQRIEGQIEVKTEQRNEEKREQLQSLVKMYEGMKPKDAAEIFDRLDMDILVRVVEEMNPRKMSAVLAKMSPDIAKQLTTAIALRSLQMNQPPAQTGASVSELPKIEGTPGG